jgi:heme/copper-type cytochrome/quinol oxidase subunit 1
MIPSLVADFEGVQEIRVTSRRISFLSLVKNCNHKGLGIYYLLSAFIFGISGTLISVLIRIELYSSGNRIISPENQNFYNISITLHGIIMIFFLVMPGLFGGFGNYFEILRILEIHSFYSTSLFYWHFLEILWLFIFLVFYE